MRYEINDAIAEYIKLSKIYQSEFYENPDQALENLDWRTFKMCIYLSIPHSCIGEFFSADEFLTEFVRILKYHHVEFEKPDNDGDVEAGQIRIAGYRAFREERDISCFFMLSLLIYCHILRTEKQEERKKFLDNMIVFPCICRIMNQFERENDQKKVMEHFGISLEQTGDVQNVTEVNQEIGKWVKRYGYLEYINESELIEVINDATEGKGFQKPGAKSGGRM